MLDAHNDPLSALTQAAWLCKGWLRGDEANFGGLSLLLGTGSRCNFVTLEVDTKSRSSLIDRKNSLA